MAFTFDLGQIATSVIGVVRRRGSAMVLVDEAKTREAVAQRTALATMAKEGVRVRLGGGRGMIGAYLRADPHGPLAGRVGHMHAKVLLTRAHMVVGSTNFSTGSQANEEVAVEVALTERAAECARSRFMELWDRAEAFEPERGAARPRSPSNRARAGGAHS